MHVLYKSLGGSGAGAGAGVGASAGAKEEEKKAISTQAVCIPPGSPSEARLVLTDGRVILGHFKAKKACFLEISLKILIFFF